MSLLRRQSWVLTVASVDKNVFFLACSAVENGLDYDWLILATVLLNVVVMGLVFVICLFPILHIETRRAVPSSAEVKVMC